jgi:hypothetical protein
MRGQLGTGIVMSVAHLERSVGVAVCQCKQEQHDRHRIQTARGVTDDEGERDKSQAWAQIEPVNELTAAIFLKEI